jgi:DNA-binding CsgD family transcriptional regulator
LFPAKGEQSNGPTAFAQMPFPAFPRLILNQFQKSDGGKAMKNYQNSDYALNRQSEGIVYRFADGEHVPGSSSYSEADFLANESGKTAGDFAALKEFSDEDYHRQKLRDYNTTHLNRNIEWAEDSGLCYSQSPEEILIARINAGEYAKKRARQAAIAKRVLAAMTDAQRRRYIQHAAYGLSTREIAEKEGISHVAVVYSLEGAEKKIKKVLAGG